MGKGWNAVVRSKQVQRQWSGREGSISRQVGGVKLCSSPSHRILIPLKALLTLHTSSLVSPGPSRFTQVILFCSAWCDGKCDQV